MCGVPGFRGFYDFQKVMFQDLALFLACLPSGIMLRPAKGLARLLRRTPLEIEAKALAPALAP